MIEILAVVATIAFGIKSLIEGLYVAFGEFLFNKYDKHFVISNLSKALLGGFMIYCAVLAVKGT